MTLDSPHDAFPRLRFLNLNRTLIRTWDDVDILGRFPALRYLRIQGCPIFEVRSSALISDSDGDRRALTVVVVSVTGKLRKARVHRTRAQTAVDRTITLYSDFERGRGNHCRRKGRRGTFFD